MTATVKGGASYTVAASPGDAPTVTVADDDSPSGGIAVSSPSADRIAQTMGFEAGTSLEEERAVAVPLSKAARVLSATPPGPHEPNACLFPRYAESRSARSLET